MVVKTEPTAGQASYLGLRMTADEFLALPENPIPYELVDGVVIMPPAPSFEHQDIAGEILSQTRPFLKQHPIGRMVPEVDVKFREDLVYKPDVVFFASPKAARVRRGVHEIPDLVVEVISPDSRNYDSRTKLHDYEAAGVREYWLIDPLRKSMRFFVARSGKFREVKVSGDHYVSKVLRGFQLDLDAIRQLFD